MTAALNRANQAWGVEKTLFIKSAMGKSMDVRKRILFFLSG